MLRIAILALYHINISNCCYFLTVVINGVFKDIYIEIIEIQHSQGLQIPTCRKTARFSILLVPQVGEWIGINKL